MLMQTTMPNPFDHAEATNLVGSGGVHLRGAIVRSLGMPRAILVISHGMNEHIGRYAFVVNALTEAGYAVAAQDHRGYGKSDGPRGVIRRFDDFVDDLDLLVALVREREPELPLVLLGHSMGGLIATRYALRHQAKLTGLVLSGPAFIVDDAVPWWKKRALLLLARVLPNLALPSDGGNVLARDPEVQRLAREDPLWHHGPTTLGFARTLVTVAAETLPRTRELTLPLLIMHGAEDRLTSPRGSELCYRLAASPDKTLKLWPDDLHEIFNELDREAVIAFLLSWLNRRA
jgi:alpha-beta hydrolase superfamily lysophospholipase